MTKATFLSQLKTEAKIHGWTIERNRCGNIEVVDAGARAGQPCRVEVTMRRGAKPEFRTIYYAWHADPVDQLDTKSPV